MEVSGIPQKGRKQKTPISNKSGGLINFIQKLLLYQDPVPPPPSKFVF